MFQNNKKGSVIVFLTSILITMIMTGMVFVHAARNICGASYSDAVLELAGRSVLAEFDRRLKDEYGLFAFYGYEDTVDSTVRFYASGSFDKWIPWEIPVKNTAIDIFRLKIQRTEVSLADYSLMDADVLEKQIEEYMNYLIAQKGMQFIKGMWKKDGRGEEIGQSAERELINRAEINSLPSQGNASNGIDISALTSIRAQELDKIINGGTSNFKVSEYIMSHFKYNVFGDKAKETFFRNEVEYILYGKMSDKDNMNRFRLDFFLLRTALNEVHIYTCREKFEAAALLAETFGPAAAIALPVIITAWSAAEAENDARRLLAGKKVALIKKESEWALDLRSAVRATKIRDDEGDIVDVEAKPRNIKGYVSPSSEAGLSYADYLRAFLFLEKRDTKLLRVMDLIQINLRGSYYSDFLIKDHHTGFSLTAKVSGKTFKYEQEY